jgi:DNA-directed RNA polymerase specialized sigma24 family protein
VSESDLPATEEEINLYEYIENTHNPCHKQVLIGYFVLGYSYKELAEMLGMTQDNCRKITQRFRELVK